MPISDVSTLYQEVWGTISEWLQNQTPGSRQKLEAPFRPIYKIGLRNAGWKAQIAAGVDATTPFTGVFMKREWAPYGGYATTVFNDGINPPVYQSWSREGNLFGTYTYPSLAFDTDSFTVAKNQALTEFDKRIRSKLKSFSGGTFLGEIVETVHQIRNPMQAMRKQLGRHLDILAGAKHVAGMNFRRNPTRIQSINTTLLNTASSTWLETQFGLKPLFADVADLTLALKDKLEKKHGLVDVSARGQGETQRSIFTFDDSAAPGIKAELHNIVRTVVRFYGSVYADFFGARLSDAEKYGLGPSDFLPTVWELIPYSFLVDYFANIGDMVNSFSTVRNRVNRISYSYRQDYVQDIRGFTRGILAPLPPGGSYTSSYVVAGKDKWTCTRIGRAKWTGSLIPDFQVKLPMSPTKLFNIAALGVQHRGLLPFKVG